MKPPPRCTLGGSSGWTSCHSLFGERICSRLFISMKVGDALVVVEPHVPSAVGGEDPLGLSDESWLRREHGDERRARFSLLEVLLAHQSFVGHSPAHRGGGALYRRTLLVDRCPDLAHTCAIVESGGVAAKPGRKQLLQRRRAVR